MLNSSVFEWSIPAVYVLERTIRKPNHPNTENEKVRFSNVFGIQMFVIRAPTVFTITVGTLVAICFLLCFFVQIAEKGKKKEDNCGNILQKKGFSLQPDAVLAD